MRYVVISPGLDHEKISGTVFDEAAMTFTITDLSGNKRVLPVCRGEGGRQYHVDASAHTDITVPSEYFPNPDQTAVWRAGLTANSIQESKKNELAEMIRQVEEQHFDATLHEIPTQHIENHLNALKADMRQLNQAKESHREPTEIKSNAPGDPKRGDTAPSK